MRKSLILMLIATLLVGAFLVSCNSDISSESSNGDKLVKVTIAGNAKGISAVSTSDDADNYYWYYSATKDDSGVYRTGQTDWKAVKANNETGLSGADLGYFSSGDWKFSFYGYTTAQTSKPDNPESSSVYYQEDNAVTVVPTTDTPTYVSVTLKEGSLGETATLVINKMNWKYTPESSTAYSATLANLGEHKTATIHFSYLSGTDAYTVITTATGDVELYTSADETTTNASDAAYAKADFSFTGNYTIPASFDGKENTIKFWVTIGDETVGDEDTINVVAYSGGVVTLSIDSTGVAVADNEAFNKVIIDENTIGFTAKRSVAVSENKSAAKTIVTKAAPSTESNALTSITFPEGALVASAEDNTTYDVEMDVVVYQTEAAQAKFVIEDTSTTAPSTFAGLDISATLTTTTGTGSSTSPVSQFSDNTAVTIRTYIAKNLTGVQVVYNGSAGAQPTFSGVSFNSEEEFADSSYETGYVKSTGLLVFKTTHFSEFYVGANEKVYDKKTNSGYTVAAFNDLSASVISDHEFILLDAAVANDIDDSRDVFNAGFKWAVIHTPSDLPNTTDFAGGYGTKIEPYLISTTDNLRKISEFYNNGYKYYKVKDGVTVLNCSEMIQPIDLNGSLDGNNVSFTHINNRFINCFGWEDEEGRPYDKRLVLKNLDATFEIHGSQGIGLIYWIATTGIADFYDVDIHGYMEGGANSGAYFCYGNSTYGKSFEAGQTVNFYDCDCDATLVCLSGNLGVFNGMGYCRYITITADSNCSFTGKAYLMGDKGLYLLSGTNVATYCSETTKNNNTKITGDSVGSIAVVNPTKNNDNSYSISKHENATKYIVYITGQFTGTNENGDNIPEYTGITMTLNSSNKISFSDNTAVVIEPFSSVSFENKQSERSARIENGVLYVSTSGNVNYTYGSVSIRVCQYDDNNALITSCGEVKIAQKTTYNGTWEII